MHIRTLRVNQQGCVWFSCIEMLMGRGWGQARTEVFVSHAMLHAPERRGPAQHTHFMSC